MVPIENKKRNVDEKQVSTCFTSSDITDETGRSCAGTFDSVVCTCSLHCQTKNKIGKSISSRYPGQLLEFVLYGRRKKTRNQEAVWYIP